MRFRLLFVGVALMGIAVAVAIQHEAKADTGDNTIMSMTEVILHPSISQKDTVFVSTFYLTDNNPPPPVGFEITFPIPPPVPPPANPYTLKYKVTAWGKPQTELDLSLQNWEDDWLRVDQLSPLHDGEPGSFASGNLADEIGMSSDDIQRHPLGAADLYDDTGSIASDSPHWINAPDGVSVGTRRALCSPSFLANKDRFTIAFPFSNDTGDGKFVRIHVLPGGTAVEAGSFTLPPASAGLMSHTIDIPQNLKRGTKYVIRLTIEDDFLSYPPVYSMLRVPEMP